MKKKLQEGSAMIMVMCVLVVFVALSFAIMLSASVLLADTQQQFAEDQLRISTRTLMQRLSEEMRPSHADGEIQTTLLKNEIDKVLCDLEGAAWKPESKRSFNVVFSEEQDAGTFDVTFVWSDDGSNDKIDKEELGKEELEKAYADKDITLEITITGKKQNREDKKEQVKLNYGLAVTVQTIEIPNQDAELSTEYEMIWTWTPEN